MSKTFFPILSTMKRTLLSLCDQAKPLWLHHILVFFWKYALSTVQKFLWASKKECFLWKSLELYNEKSVTCAIDWQQSFWFSFIAVHFLPFGHSVMLCMRNLFLKGDSSVFVFSFLFFFSQIEFFNQNDDVLPFSQFPPERFLYLNVGLISLDVWLVDKIYFIFNFLSCASTFIWTKFDRLVIWF